MRKILRFWNTPKVEKLWLLRLLLAAIFQSCLRRLGAAGPMPDLKTASKSQDLIPLTLQQKSFLQAATKFSNQKWFGINCYDESMIAIRYCRSLGLPYTLHFGHRLRPNLEFHSWVVSCGYLIAGGNSQLEDYQRFHEKVNPKWELQ